MTDIAKLQDAVAELVRVIRAEEKATKRPTFERHRAEWPSLWREIDKVVLAYDAET